MQPEMSRSTFALDRDVMLTGDCMCVCIVTDAAG